MSWEKLVDENCTCTWKSGEENFRYQTGWSWVKIPLIFCEWHLQRQEKYRSTLVWNNELTRCCYEARCLKHSDTCPLSADYDKHKAEFMDLVLQDITMGHEVTSMRDLKILHLDDGWFEKQQKRDLCCHSGDCLIYLEAVVLSKLTRSELLNLYPTK